MLQCRNRWWNPASTWTTWLHADWKKSSRWSETTHTGSPQVASSLHLFPRKQAMCLHREAHYPLWTKRCLQSSIILKLLSLLLQLSASQRKHHSFLSSLADFEHLPNLLFFFYGVVPKLLRPTAFQMSHSSTYCLWWLVLAINFTGLQNSQETLDATIRVFLEAIISWWQY